jgi:subtilisin family serine protease
MTLARPGHRRPAVLAVLTVTAVGAVGLVAPASAGTPSTAPDVAVDLALDVPQPVTAPVDGSSVGAVVDTGDGLEVVTVDAPDGDAQDIVADLERDPDVVDAFVDVPAAIAAGDQYRSRQWNLDALNLGLLPDGTDDGAGQLVAVVDTGVRASHPDLMRPDGYHRVRCDLGADFTVTSRYSVGNGCTDPNGHGTHVAGIVSAVADNTIGVAGVSSARIMPVRVLDADGRGMAARINAGIIWAVDHGATVMNLSFVSDRTTAYDAAISYALQHDVVVVAAAGNNRALGNTPQSPASTSGVISVAATDVRGLSAPYSYSGPTVLVAAPGDDVLSTTPSGYAFLSGTSMAAPHVAGVLARYRALNPGATGAQIRTAVGDTAIDLEQPGRDDDTGYGLIDALELLGGGDAPPDPARGAVPSAPRLTGVTAGVRQLTVRWSAPTWDGGSAITEYVADAYPVVSGALGDPVQVTALPGASQVTVPGLTPGVSYVVAVHANNGHPGEGQPSLPSGPVRLANVPGAPRIGTPNAGPAAARVRWSVPASTGGSPITGYVVRVYQGSTFVKQVPVPATAREVRLAGLSNGRAHSFVVKAVNAVGSGAFSARSIAVTPRQAPSAPFVGRPVPGNDAARVYWSAPKSNGGAYVSAYVIKIYQGTRGLGSITVRGTARSALVTGLGNRGWYSFTVTAKNVVGLGPPSPRTTTVRTS